MAGSGSKVMGRKHYNERTPQHSRHMREQRRWRAGEAPVPRAVGIRRELSPDSAMRIMSGLRQLQICGELPNALDFKLKPYVSLVPLGEIGRQTRKGIAPNFDVSRIGRRLLRECESVQKPEVMCDIKGISMKTGGDLKLTLVSDELEAERFAAAEAFEAQGFKGLLRDCAEKPLHLTLATCRRDEFPYDVRQDMALKVVEDIDAVHHWEEPLVTGAFSIYPRQEELAA